MYFVRLKVLHPDLCLFHFSLKRLSELQTSPKIFEVSTHWITSEKEPIICLKKLIWDDIDTA